MKISTRGRYALRMMLDMALSDSDKPVRVKEIAERQEISEKYMEQIMPILTISGYVKSFRGNTVVICWHKNLKNIQLERFYGQQKAVWLR